MLNSKDISILENIALVLHDNELLVESQDLTKIISKEKPKVEKLNKGNNERRAKKRRYWAIHDNITRNIKNGNYKRAHYWEEKLKEYKGENE